GSGTCTSSILVAGDEATGVPCGSATGNTVSSVTASGLDNGTSYVVAVTARDAVGNESVLSTLLCGEPQPVDDFFSTYRKSGGEGGGGYCTIAGVDLGPSDLGLLGLVVAAGGALVRRRRKRKSLSRAAAAAAPLALVALLAWPRTAHAQSHIPDTDWRHKSRPYEEPADTQFAFEVRFAPYWPAVDDEPGLSGKPYETTFGTAPRFYFGLEFDWMPLRIPYVGMFGPGFGWGYTWASEKARKQGCTGSAEACASEDITSLSIMPMHLSAVLRGDELMRRTGVPIVPYAKFGPAVGLWSSAKSSGDATVKETVDGKTVDVAGEGTTWGLNLALGGMIALNWLDASSAGRLRESTGIGHIYIFGEWMDAMLNGFGTGGQMYVGTSTFACGLAGDF
ncbi:MAG TPA: MXAN_2562 family outer membrane beta-barrel protein, partial [Polyangiaceae bacterium]|nr:MXAN_2562 family outer membrane beta-barrel protein [Polyangiaceae bacterium]